MEDTFMHILEEHIKKRVVTVANAGDADNNARQEQQQQIRADRREYQNIPRAHP